MTIIRKASLTSIVFICILLTSLSYGQQRKRSLHRAVKQNKLEEVKVLLESEIEVNQKDESGRTPFFWVNSKEMINLLIKAEAEINIVDDCGASPLDVVSIKIRHIRPDISRKYIALASYLRELGAKSGYEIKPRLSGAAERNDLAMVKKLIKEGLDVNKNIGPCHAYSPLHTASLLGHKKIVKLLLEAGAVPDRKSLISTKNLEVLQMLIDVGTDPNHMNAALHYAASLNRVEIAKELITAGANVNNLNEDGKTPLDKVCADDSLMQELMIKSGGKSGYKIKPTLFEAINRNDIEMIKELIRSGHNVNARHHKNYMTPLMYACGKGSSKTVSLLLEAGADVNAVRSKRSNPETAIHRAHSHADITALLINAKANVNAKDNYGNTPLYVPVSKNNIKTVKLLIDAGVDVNSLNKYQETALDCARSKEMKELLIKHGAKLSAHLKK